MRYALVENGVVTNIIIWDGVAPLNLPSAPISIGENIVDMGYLYSNGIFSAPEVTP